MNSSAITVLAAVGIALLVRMLLQKRSASQTRSQRKTVPIEQLQKWHEEDEHQKIVDEIETVPEQERSYELTSLLARALNNLDQYGRAMNLLLSVKAEGEADPLWHFRVGYSLYYMGKEAEAVPYFEKSIELGDQEENTRLLLGLAKQEAAEKEKRKALRGQMQRH
ncbi:MAG: hypothetical protein FWF33_02610 [Clostridiales bacterium]|nr:hypothetical protein [Clostridiales bacterium]